VALSPWRVFNVLTSDQSSDFRCVKHVISLHATNHSTNHRTPDKTDIDFFNAGATRRCASARQPLYCDGALNMDSHFSLLTFSG
jgi:hypothetical protein